MNSKLWSSVIMAVTFAAPAWVMVAAQAKRIDRLKSSNAEWQSISTRFEKIVETRGTMLDSVIGLAERQRDSITFKDKTIEKMGANIFSIISQSGTTSFEVSDTLPPTGGVLWRSNTVSIVTNNVSQPWEMR